MAVRKMTTKDRAGLPNVETVRDYPGHEEGRMTHAPSCPHYVAADRGVENGLTEKYADCVTDYSAPERCYGPFEALYMETTHVGLVLETREWNGRDDSDFYAVCWNHDKGEPERVEYATTRGWTYPNSAHVDATPEVVAAWEAWSRACQAARETARLETERRTPARGKTLKVVKGRKVPVGTVGECTWYGEGKKFGYYGSTPMRVGLRTLDGTVHWTDAKNVEVVLDTEAASAA